ncbi:MAG TPA: Rieske 2Fe-2S domain-containing protein [Terriglobia bacterium]|jgi:nitrite reductase (NADH) small subunit|nr:Rieske 2Fe-2S domain-containing protein [Terriglobia bacterium]
MTDFTKCASLSDLPPGACRTVEVSGRPVALFNVAGTVHCLANECLHRGGPLGEGTLEGDVVTCPWHLWQYNVRTGENLIDPAVKVKTYAVQVDGDDVKVAV